MSSVAPGFWWHVGWQSSPARARHRRRFYVARGENSRTWRASWVRDLTPSFRNTLWRGVVSLTEQPREQNGSELKPEPAALPGHPPSIHSLAEPMTHSGSRGKPTPFVLPTNCSRTTPTATRQASARDRSCRREPRPPARVRRAPRQLALGLRVGGAANLGHHHHAGLPGEQPPDEPRYVHRLLRA